MKYIVKNFPEPSAIRMKDNPKKLNIVLENGWGYKRVQSYTLSKETNEFSFDVPDSFKPRHIETALDANVFSVLLTYSNATKSRNETFGLIPIEMNHICGLQGYDGMIDPPCLPCKVASDKFRDADIESETTITMNEGTN